MPELVDKPTLAEALAEYIKQNELKNKIDTYMETEPMKATQTTEVQNIAATTIQEILTTNQYVTANTIGGTYATKSELSDAMTELSSGLASKVDNNTLVDNYATKSDLVNIDVGSIPSEQITQLQTDQNLLRVEMYRNFDNFDTLLSQNYLTEASLSKKVQMVVFNPGQILNGTYEGISLTLTDTFQYRNRLLYLLAEGGTQFQEPDVIKLLLDTVLLEENQELEIYNSCVYCKIQFHNTLSSRMITFQNDLKTDIPPLGRAFVKNLGRINIATNDPRDYFFIYGEELVSSIWKGMVPTMEQQASNINSLLDWSKGSPADMYMIEPQMEYTGNHNGMFLYFNPLMNPEPATAVLKLNGQLQNGAEIVLYNGSSVTKIVIDTAGYGTTIYRDATKTALSPKGTASVKHIPSIIQPVMGSPDLIDAILIIGNLEAP